MELIKHPSLRLLKKKKMSSTSSTTTSTSSSAPPDISTLSLKDSDAALVPSSPSSGAASQGIGKKRIIWECDECKRRCIPIRSESRCICNHRYKVHKGGKNGFKCETPECPCNHFFFIVAEGAWILRCRCKHKGSEHDPSKRRFLCSKKGCPCTGFDSPWVCNCAHPWSKHAQRVVEIGGDDDGADLGTFSDLTTIMRTDISKPLPAYK